MTEPRIRKKHNYKELKSRGFTKAAKAVKPTETRAHGIKTPQTFEEAINGPQSPEWWAAMKKECLEQLKRRVFRITKPPYDQKVIDGKWVYLVKENPDGTVASFKARWVAKGYSQVEGRDYQEKYAPVVRTDTSRIMLALTAKLGMKMRQYDIVTAFLSAQMDRMIYTKEPKGFETGKGNACLLNKALYGLVQSAYLWFTDIKGTFLSFGLTQSKHDDSLFFDTKRKLYVTVYVDDIKAYCRDDSTLDALSEHLNKSQVIEFLSTNSS